MKDFTMPGIEELLLKLTGRPLKAILEAELNRQGISIKKVEDIEVDRDEDYWGTIKGQRVTLQDGRVFVTRPFEVSTGEPRRFTTYKFAEKLKDGKYVFEKPKEEV